MVAQSALGVASLLLIALAGCTPQLPRYQPALQTEGQLFVYLQPLPQEAHRLRLRIAAVSALRDDGTALPLTLDLGEVRGEELVGVQRRLASATLPPGRYRGLSLQIESAALLREDATAALLVPEEPLEIDQDFRITRRAASTLFLTLHDTPFVAEGVRFAPDLSLEKPQRELTGLLGLVTDSKTNLIFVFNKHTMQIVDTIATSSGPEGVLIDAPSGWAYVALAGDDRIEAIELTTRVILRDLKLRFGDEPVEIALSYDGRYLVSANAGTNSASIVDARSLIEITRVPLRSDPAFVVTSPDLSRAFLVQPHANVITQISLPDGEAFSQILEDTPGRAALSGDGANLYVVSRYSTDLLVLDASTLALKGRIDVGTAATSVAVDPKTELVYVGRRRGGISIVEPTALTAIDRIRVDGSVTYIATDDDEDALFVLVPDRRLVLKLDRVSKRQRGLVEVDEGAYAVAVTSETTRSRPWRGLP